MNISAPTTGKFCQLAKESNEKVEKQRPGGVVHTLISELNQNPKDPIGHALLYPKKTDGFIKQFPKNSQDFVRRLLGNRECVERIKTECSEKFNNLKKQRIWELLDQQSPATIKELHNRLQHSMHDNRNQKDQSCTKKAFDDETFINAVNEKHSEIFRFS